MKKFLLLFILSSSIVYSQTTFTDVAIAQGINFTCGGIYGAGVSFCDIDNDGYDDIIVCSGYTGMPPGVYKNNGGTGFTHMTVPALDGIINPVSPLCADYDNDGKMDLFISSFGGKCRLLKGSGGFNFTDVTQQAGLIMDSSRYTAACWGDYDNDGYLDLYIGVYRGYFGVSFTTPNILFHNERNGTFSNKTITAGVQNLTTQVLAMAFMDYNNDGKPDIYIASDRRRGNTLYKNNGDGTFTDVSHQTSSYIEANSMGLSVVDYDNNGYFDLYISNSEEGNALLKNNGNGTFTDVGPQLGLTVNCVCWGNEFFDYDNDADLDLYVATEYGVPNNKDYLFKNNGNNTFSSLTNIGIGGNRIGFGCAVGDINNDGYPDIFVTNVGDPSNLFKSNGGSNNWLKVKLVGNISNRNGIGGIIEVYRGANKYIRSVTGGNSYISEKSFTQLLGLGTSTTVDSLIVRWPSGWKTRMDNVAAGQTLIIDENATIGIGNNNNNIPSKYVLSQNYPNPFNPSTTIRFDIPKQTFVKVAVYDVMGREVEVLANQEVHAGEYKVTWNASNQASGIYFYTIISADYSQTKKMMLVK